MGDPIDAFPQRGDVAMLIRTMDWAGTPLGPPATWPASLRTVLRLMLTSRYAMWMGWGPDLLVFYNDTYARETLGAKHPWALGRPFREVWSEIYETLAARVTQVLTTGEATWDSGLLLFLERSGYREETYHTFSYSPAPGDAPGEIGGLFCVVIEETERVIGERRMALLRDFASLISQTNSTDDVFDAVERCLTSDARDIPFALIFLFDDDARRGRLACSPGFRGPHRAAPEQVAAEGGAPWPFLSVLASGVPAVVELDADQAWPVGAWETPPSRALVVPIDLGQARPAGVLVAGLNPHRPLDAAMRGFVELFVGQMAAGLSNARAYEEEKKRADALAEIDRAKTTFFSNVSHEFRTPLTLMLAPIEDMRAEPGRQEKDSERLALLHRNALRLLRLVNTLLDFSRIEAGRVDAVYEPTDLAALTADLASSFRAATERAGLSLVVDCAPLPEDAYVDRAMWEKIVLNLVSNAFKFTFEGSITVRVRLVDAGFELELADTGTGIAPAELPRLFERFHRVEGARSRSHEGSGIGLALVEELVRFHGGAIAVDSEEGRGTMFVIRIPRGSAHLPPERIKAARGLASTSTGAMAYVEEALRWTGDATVEPSTPGPEQDGALRPRILFADDNADMRDYVARLLGERWDVTVTASGDDALASIRRSPPDLVLSDVMMPGLDGFGLLQAMRADPVLRAIPVIVLSARAGEDAAAEGLGAGADDYLVKPFTARDLLVRVASKLSSARATREANAIKENLYRHFMQAPFPVAVLQGANHVIELANAAVARAWGKTVEEAVGRPLLELLPELRTQPFVGYLEEVLRTGIAHEGASERALLPTGPGGAMVEVFYSFVFAPLFDASRTRTEGVLLSGIDVTAQVRSRQEVERARDEAQELAAGLKAAVEARDRALEQAERTSRAKDEFLATMSHELRTPLNAMLGWSKILRSSGRDEQKLEHGLAVIERNAAAQARLVSDLLDVSRIISGKLRLAVQRLELSAVAYAAVEVVRQAADAKGVRLVVSLDPDLGALLGDPDRIQQIIWNLLINAVKFTSAGGTVTVTGHRRDSTLSVRVRDTGQGIPVEHLPHIFERFRQVDASTSRAHGGLGLGLAIVRHLAEAHGGSVAAQSAGPGQGSTFTVTLPIRAVVHDASTRGPEGGVAENVPRSAPDGASLRGSRILVVDDEEDSLDLLRVVLESAGASFVGASNASEALAATEREPFDIVISDIGMPGTDGYVFMRDLRARGADVPAIALTAYARAEDAERALRAGFGMHIAKPVDAQVLVTAVQRMIRARLEGWDENTL